jgi:hypothetical protein
MKLTPCLAVAFLSFCTIASFSQVNVQRAKTPATSKPISNAGPGLAKISTAGNTKRFNPAIYYRLNKPNTFLAGGMTPDDVDKPKNWFFTGSDFFDYSSLQGWKQMFCFKKIPASAKAIRYEVSQLPYPVNNNQAFNGIIYNGSIDRGVMADSIVFTIEFSNSDNSNASAPAQVRMPVRNAPVTNNPGYAKIPVAPAGTFQNTNSEAFKIVGNLFKYYIRAIALTAEGARIGEYSNTVTAKYYSGFQGIPYVKPELNKLSDDYTITSIKYVPVHFEEYPYNLCLQVTGYDEAGLNLLPYGQAFKNAYPAGKVICPEPPQDKSWYEKAFNGITGVISAAVSAADHVISDVHGYVNTYVGVLETVLLTLPNLAKQQAEVLKGKVLTVADAAMAAAGVNISISNIDEVLMLTKGQIIYSVNQVIDAEENITQAVKNELKQKFQEGLSNSIAQSVSKNIINSGYIHYRPDPRGQYRHAYIEVEITRTGNEYNGKPVFLGNTIYNKASKTVNDYSALEKKTKPVTLTASLYNAELFIPYLKNTGDKIKMVVVLEPVKLYVHRDKITGYLNKVNSDKIGYANGAWHDMEFELSVKEGQHSPGFQLMFDGSVNTFSFGNLKIKPGVLNGFVHP